MFSGPFFYIVVPLLAGFITALLSRRRRLTAVVGLAILLLLAVRLWFDTDLPRDVTLAGRHLLLSEGIRALFLFIYAGMAALYSLFLFFPTGQKFVPWSLVALAPLIAALMSGPTPLGSLYLAAGIGISSVVIQDDRAGGVNAALRTLGMAVLALPLLLLAHWYQQAQGPVMAAVTSRFLLTAAFILFALFPFQVWLTGIIREATPAVWLYMVGLVQMIVVAFFYSQISLLTHPFLDAQLLRLVFIVAGITLAVAALFLLTAVDIRRLINGLLLVDLALVLLTLTLPLSVGWQTAVTILVARFFSLLALGGGILALQHFGAGMGINPQGEALDGRVNLGLGRRLPLTFILTALGCFSLLGLPITIGFAGRWSFIFWLGEALSGEIAGGWWILILLLAVMGLGVYTLLRAIPYFTTPAAAGQRQPAETLVVKVTAGVGIALLIFLAIQPHIILGLAREISAAFGF